MMGEYTKADLEEARNALTSTLRKCEKIQEGKKLPASQQTLLDRRVRALRLALTLIEKEAEGKQDVRQ